MAHIGRSVKNVEAPRPLKSQSRSSLKNNFMVIEELIQLIENVAISLQSGINNTEPMATLVQNLRIHGPQLESVSKDTLDRAFVVFRNASQDERLNIMTRLNLLELIELRAKGWEDNGINSYYKTKQATNAELNDVQNHVDPTQTAFLSTSPTFGGINMGGNAAAAATAAAIASVGSANQQHLLLGPGEVIRNSGKFPKPTKIPGKTYCKDEVVIRNADSGKVMGIKGRRVHMIEELSETIISFQRVNPGAKERLVQITGPAEDKINYAKQLIEDTIRRNASPVRLDPNMVSSHAGGGGGGSCSSLASSNSDEPVQPRTPGASSLSNRLSFNSAQNFMTAAAASQQMVHLQQQQQQHMANIQQAMQTSTPVANAAVAAAAAGKTIRPHSQMLLHSYSTNDASLGEYKFTCNVGQHVIKITGDCCELVRIAKLVLDDHFSSAEFLASIEAGAAFDTSPISTPTTPMTGTPQFAMSNPLHAASPMATDSGIGLNYMNSNNNQDNDDDVFFPDSNNLSKSASQSNGLSRSRRSHFSRKDSTPEAAANTANTSILRQKSETGNNNNTTNTETTRIVHQYEHLLYYAKSPHSWALPNEWQKICEKFPAIIRNKVTTSTTTPTTTHASSTATNLTTTTTTTNNSNCNTSTTTITTTPYNNPTNSCFSSYQNPKASNSTLTLRVACNNNSNNTAAANAPNNFSCNQQNVFSATATTTVANTFTTNTNIANNPLTTTNNSSNFMKNSSYTATSPLTHNNIQQQSSLLAASNNVTNISTLPSHLTHNNNNLSNSFNHSQHNNNNTNSSCSNQVYYNNDGNNINNTSNKSLESAANNSLTYKLNSHHGSLALNIRRKGFFNRLTYSIDEDGVGGAGHYEAALKTPELPATAAASTTSANTTTHHQHQQSLQHHHNLTNANNASINVTAGSGRIHSAGLNRHLTSVRTGPMTSVPLTTITNTDTRQKLLNKQIKIISDIMVESSKCTGAAVTNKSNENLKSNYDNTQQTKTLSQADSIAKHNNGDDNDDDDDEVEIVAVTSNAMKPQLENVTTSTSSSSSSTRPKLNYEFRSYSTCD